jgi:Putative restriction endonuclease
MIAEIATPIEEKTLVTPQVVIPEALIYEVVKGKPIYYKGYKHYLNGTKTIEELKIDSTLQAWLKSRLTILLGNYLIANGYDITTGEQGFILPSGDKRGADIAIFKEGSFVIDEHYSRNTPEVILEIDVSANMDNETEFDYIAQKTTDYHEFGVQNVIWIFTKTKKVMVAEKGETWLTKDWTKDVQVMEGLTLNLSKMIEKKGD